MPYTPAAVASALTRALANEKSQALQVPALRVLAAMSFRPDWREEQVVVPTGLRPL